MNIILLLGLFAAGIFAASAVHQKRLVKARGVPREEFVQALVREDIPAEISGAVYDYYQRESSVASFQVAPDFSLEELFRKSHEDVDDDAQSIIAGLACTYRMNRCCANGRSRSQPFVTWLDG